MMIGYLISLGGLSHRQWPDSRWRVIVCAQMIIGCGAEFTALEERVAPDSGADTEGDSSSDARADANPLVDVGLDAELHDASPPPDSNTCAFDGGRVSSTSCGNADVPMNFRQHMNNSGTCVTRATPISCQCAATYTCVCLLANFVSSGSTTACPSDNVPTGCSWVGTLLVVECPFP